MSDETRRFTTPVLSKPALSTAVAACLIAAGPLIGCTQAENPRGDANTLPSDQTTGAKSGEAVAILAGGCFWCTEAVFEQMKGINDVESGYIGGTKADANYRTVCSYKMPIPGKALHAEAVRVFYDPSVISYQKILEIFFKTHDPTSLYRQGADAGPQYRTSIFYIDDEQKMAAKKYIDKLNEERAFRGKVVTLLEDGSGASQTSTFYPAEEYHQDYFRKNPRQAYCQAVVAKKARKAKNLFSDWLKED